MSESLDICVMLGGPSSERKVSLQSGAAVVEARRGLGHLVRAIGRVDGEFRLPQNTGIAVSYTYLRLPTPPIVVVVVVQGS